MRKVRNITVAVGPELYRQTRRLAVEYNTSVTDRLRFLLLVMPEALKAARYPGGRPQFGTAADRAAGATAAAQTPVPLQHFRSKSIQKPRSRAAFSPRKCHLRRTRHVKMWIGNALTAAPSITSATTSENPQIISHFNSAPNSFPASQIGPSKTPFSENANPSCKTVKPTQTVCFQPLAALQSAALQILYFSTLLITKTLRVPTSIILNE